MRLTRTKYSCLAKLNWTSPTSADAGKEIGASRAGNRTGLSLRTSVFCHQALPIWNRPCQRGAAGKVPVFGILTREGKVHVEVVPNVQAETLLGITVKKVRRGSIVYTDKYKAYDSLMFCGYRHLNVDHSSRFVDGKVHINGCEPHGWRRQSFAKIILLSALITSNQEPTLSVEGFWSWAKERLFKHHGISPKHFPLYLKELEFRYNHRFELIFEQLVAYMSDFVPELPGEEVPPLSSTSQRE